MNKGGVVYGGVGYSRTSAMIGCNACCEEMWHHVITSWKHYQEQWHYRLRPASSRPELGPGGFLLFLHRGAKSSAMTAACAPSLGIPPLITA